MRTLLLKADPKPPNRSSKTPAWSDPVPDVLEWQPGWVKSVGGRFVLQVKGFDGQGLRYFSYPVSLAEP